jgi:hypothetical protein
VIDLGYKCLCCGRYFLDPIPTVCNKCQTPIPNGTVAGNSFQKTKPLTKLQLGGIIHKKIVLERLPLEWGHFVEFLSDLGDEGDTGNLPKVRR